MEGNFREQVARNLKAVKERVADAARRFGRGPDEITLVAVSKYQPPEKIYAALEAGHRVMGENRIQEARDKFREIGEKAEWHFIGHLQTNKVKYIFDIFTLVHSVDSLKLAEEISRKASSRGKVVDILLQVKLGGEETKHGILPGELAETAGTVSRLPGVSLKGLMTIPPPAEGPEGNRPHFNTLRKLAEEVKAIGLDGVTMDILSMGMSDDFETAIEEGATHIRVGSAIFGARDA